MLLDIKYCYQSIYVGAESPEVKFSKGLTPSDIDYWSGPVDILEKKAIVSKGIKTL